MLLRLENGRGRTREPPRGLGLREGDQIIRLSSGHLRLGECAQPLPRVREPATGVNGRQHALGPHSSMSRIEGADIHARLSQGRGRSQSEEYEKKSNSKHGRSKVMDPIAIIRFRTPFCDNPQLLPRLR